MKLRNPLGPSATPRQLLDESPNDVTTAQASRPKKMLAIYSFGHSKRERHIEGMCWEVARRETATAESLDSAAPGEQFRDGFLANPTVQQNPCYPP